MLPTLMGWVSPRGPRARLAVLIFHRVLPEPDPLFPTEVCARQFDAICGWLARDFRVLPLLSAIARLRDGELPSRALAITFDDGYADNAAVALPILQRHGLPATVFVSTGFLDGGRMWNDTLIESIRRTRCASIDAGQLGLDGIDGLMPLETTVQRRAAIARLLPAIKYLEPVARGASVERLRRLLDADPPNDLMLTTPQLRALAAGGIDIGAHTVSHPILARLSDDAAFDEIARSKGDLEASLDREVPLFAYPNGKPGEDYGPGAPALVRRAGFAAAVSTVPGAASRRSDPFQIPRFTPWDRTRARFEARLLVNALQS